MPSVAIGSSLYKMAVFSYQSHHKLGSCSEDTLSQVIYNIDWDVYHHIYRSRVSAGKPTD